MTMLSFRVDAQESAALDAWAELYHRDRSALLRQALHQYLIRLRAENDIQAWERTPLTDGERTLAEIADWGPAEDWSDWLDGTR